MIGEGLRERYRVPQKLSHELFVALLQLNEQEHRRNGHAVRTPSRAERSGRGGPQRAMAGAD